MSGPGGARAHPDGFCICRHHVGRAWDRPEHWTRDDVAYLEEHYGLVADTAIARHLGRSVTGIRLKAKRLGLHKRAAAWTARDVAAIFGIDCGTIGKVWIRRSLMRARAVERRSMDGRPNRWLIAHAEVERFIREHPEWIDVRKMPDSPFRDLAARDPWVSLVEVHHLTGRNHHAVALLIRGGEIRGGEIRGARRGSHWYVPLADVGRIRHLAPDAIEESVFRRESVLEVRRNRRKLAAA